MCRFFLFKSALTFFLSQENVFSVFPLIRQTVFLSIILYFVVNFEGVLLSHIRVIVKVERSLFLKLKKSSICSRVLACLCVFACVCVCVVLLCPCGQVWQLQKVLDHAYMSMCVNAVIISVYMVHVHIAERTSPAILQRFFIT